MQTFTATEIISSIMDIFYHLYEVEVVQGLLMIAIVGGILVLLGSILKIRK